MSYHAPWVHSDDPNTLDPTYGTSVLPTGLPSFVRSPAILPQYSSTGRMQPEFLEGSINADDDEDGRPIIAQGETLNVLGYAPRNGTHNTPILVRLLFRTSRTPQTKVSLRVKMGNIPLMTNIVGIEAVNGIGGEWRLHVLAPDPVELDIVGLDVPLIVQAMDISTANIIDDVCIGPFRFWDRVTAADEGAPPAVRSPFSEHFSVNPTASSDQSREAPLLGARYSLDDSVSTTGVADTREPLAANSARGHAELSIEVPPYETSEIPEGMSSKQASPPILRTPAHLAHMSGNETYPARLLLRGDLNSMTQNWTTDEFQSGRRIIEFFRTQTCGSIDVNFAPVSGDESRDPSKIIVSCIWRVDTKEFIITSVDTINLLERLVGTRFTTEEKNRIRRNLQGFKPATVSKHHPDSKAFFQTLMHFPAPRPRNIEKDVKAFGWSKLPSMLDKIVSKYRFVSSPGGSDSDDGRSSPRLIVMRDLDSVSAESPGIVGQSLSAAHTPSSTQESLQDDARPTRTGALSTSNSFVDTSSPLVDDADPIHFEPPEHSTYPDGVGLSQSSSVYGTMDSLMEISESTMDAVRKYHVEHGHSVSEYHEHYEAYPEMPYSHSVGLTEGNVMDDGQHSGMDYMAHTSREYT